MLLIENERITNAKSSFCKQSRGKDNKLIVGFPIPVAYIYNETFRKKLAMGPLQRIEELLSLFSKIGDLYINKNSGSGEEKYHWHGSAVFDVWEALSSLQAYLLTFSKTEPTFAVMRSNGTVWSPMFKSRTISASSSTLRKRTQQTWESFRFLNAHSSRQVSRGMPVSIPRPPEWSEHTKFFGYTSAYQHLAAFICVLGDFDEIFLFFSQIRRSGWLN